MLKWRENYVESSQKKCITVCLNGEMEGKTLYVEPDWKFHEFLNAASQRLRLAPAGSRAFNMDGTEIDDCMMIDDDGVLFISTGDDFLTQLVNIPDNNGESSGKMEQLPAMVSGYKVSRLLGRGAFGEVRVGEHQLTNDVVALKFLNKSEIMSIRAAERTATEIQCLATLKHHNIIILQQHVETVNHIVLVFELMEGGDLLKFLCMRGNTAKAIALPPDEARMVFHQIVSGISFAHSQHICHRDLKLENILLKSNSLSHVKLADFGLSDFYRPGSTMKSNCGTLSFLAPEVFRGTSNAGPPLDVWSLGVILFAILCGRLPFENIELTSNKRPRDQIIRGRIMKCQYKIDDDLTPEVKDLIRRMLKLDTDERASIPEIFNHCWMRQSSQYMESSSKESSNSGSGKEATGSHSSKTNIDKNNHDLSFSSSAIGGGLASINTGLNNLTVASPARSNSPTNLQNNPPTITPKSGRVKPLSRTSSISSESDKAATSNQSVSPSPLGTEASICNSPRGTLSSEKPNFDLDLSTLNSPTFKLIPLRKMSLSNEESERSSAENSPLYNNNNDHSDGHDHFHELIASPSRQADGSRPSTVHGSIGGRARRGSIKVLASERSPAAGVSNRMRETSSSVDYGAASGGGSLCQRPSRTPIVEAAAINADEVSKGDEKEKIPKQLKSLGRSSSYRTKL